MELSESLSSNADKFYAIHYNEKLWSTYLSERKSETEDGYYDYLKGLSKNIERDNIGNKGLIYTRFLPVDRKDKLWEDFARIKDDLFLSPDVQKLKWFINAKFDKEFELQMPKEIKEDFKSWLGLKVVKEDWQKDLQEWFEDNTDNTVYWEVFLDKYDPELLDNTPKIVGKDWFE